MEKSGECALTNRCLYGILNIKINLIFHFYEVTMLHEGHRERLRAKAEEYGMTCLEEHEALELLLGYGIARRNTNEIAHELINRAGSLRGVFDMSLAELEKTKGIGHYTAFMIRLIGFIMNRHKAPPKKRVDLSRFSAVREYAKMLYDGTTTETLYALLLDKKFKLIKRVNLSSGSAWQIGIDKSVVARAVLEEDASAVILLHNHPDGVLAPSRDDLNFTVEIERTFSAINMPFVEHMVYADGECYPIMKSNRQRATIAIEYDYKAEI